MTVLRRLSGRMHTFLLLLNLILFVVAVIKATDEFRVWSERRREGMFQSKNPDLKDWLKDNKKSKAKPYDKDDPGAGPIIDV